MRITSLLALSAIWASSAQAQIVESGFINFNVGSSPTPVSTPQPVSFFGCNNTTFDTTVDWDSRNQVVSDIPYGYRSTGSGKRYFISKYYIASPPAYRSPTDKRDPILGLVTPDRFVFTGQVPAQIVDLDYLVLEPTWLQEVPVDFTHDPGAPGSCKSQGVTAIPINTVCPDLPWRIGARGGSGIGQLKDGSGTAFVPLRNERTDPYRCSVTLLDDVILEHEVYFLDDGRLDRTIDLTAYYENRWTMNLVCLPRDAGDIPAGCAPPE